MKRGRGDFGDSCPFLVTSSSRGTAARVETTPVHGGEYFICKYSSENVQYMV